MSLIFLNGLMPERHGQFMRELGRVHTLAGTRMGALADNPDVTTIAYYDDRRLQAPAVIQDLESRVAEQTAILATNLATDMGAGIQSPLAGAPLSAREIAEVVRPRVARVLLEELRFRTFVRDHPVAMVISGSDFASHSRVIARTARQLGIRTLDLEHGFFFNRVTGDDCRVRGRMPLLFASEYVVVDNDLEKEQLEYEQTRFPGLDAGQEPRFLSLGTPVDTVATHALPCDQARAKLGLDPERIQVLIGGSWIEARNVQMLLGAQIDIMDTYEDLFRSLAAGTFRHRLQLTIKLHPADCRPEVRPNVTAALEAMASRYGLPHPLILADSLAEAVSACDVLLTMSNSSILYDAFLMGKPTVVLFPRYLVTSDREGWRQDSTMTLRAGVCEVATDGADAWRRIESWLEPERRRQFARDHEAFSHRYGLWDRPVAEKCSAILAWIDQQLADPQAVKSL
ncbi:MAG: hypothetical protein IPH48_14180 [bacterium]|nr:hypothetical protein [bacterium]